MQEEDKKYDELIKCPNCHWEGTNFDIEKLKLWNNNCVAMMEKDWVEIEDGYCPRCHKPIPSQSQ
jgi:hypothetical protein